MIDADLGTRREHAGKGPDPNDPVTVARRLQDDLMYVPAADVDLAVPDGWDNDELKTLLLLTSNFTLRLVRWCPVRDYGEYLDGLLIAYMRKVDEFGFGAAAAAKFKIHLVALASRAKAIDGEDLSAGEFC